MGSAVTPGCGDRERWPRKIPSLKGRGQRGQELEALIPSIHCSTRAE